MAKSKSYGKRPPVYASPTRTTSRMGKTFTPRITNRWQAKTRNPSGASKMALQKNA